MRTTTTFRFVSEGRVSCPRRGDVDIDKCAGCPSLEQVKVRDDGSLVVACKAVRIPLEVWIA